MIKIIRLLLLISIVLYSCKTDKNKEIIKTETKIETPLVEKEVNKSYNILDDIIKEAFKKTRRVKIDSVMKDLMLIKTNSFYKISLGDSLSTLQKRLQKETLKTLQGDFDIYAVYDEHNKKLARIYPSRSIKEVVGTITIISNEAKTKTGISVGMTFGDLLRKHPDITVNGSEIEGETYAKHGNLSFLLGAYFNTYEVDPSKVNRATKIKEIVINR